MAVSDQEKAANERIARLYRDTAHEEPPSHLDSALCRAARASGPPRASRAHTWLRSWRLPFAFVAVGLVSVSLVTLVLEDGGERLTDVPQRPIAATPQAPAELDTASPAARPVPAEQSVQRDPPPPAADRRETRETAKTLQENTEYGNAGTSAPERQSPAGAAPAPPAGARMRKSEGLASPRAEAASEIAKLEGEPPAIWLERVAILRREGRESEADALLVEFKARFPGATLPQQRQ